jgi:hypothetical protein
MSRILIHVEGETEETFVNEVLAPHLLPFGHYPSARLLGNARQRSRRGGICGWNVACHEIINHLRSDPNIYVTTMVDYYALPQSGDAAWPNRAIANALPFAQKSPTVQQVMQSDINRLMGDGFNPQRFIPYVMMHEFEGLLFSDCLLFAKGIAQKHLAPAFQAIRDQFATPEEINDSPMTAPSKRVEALVPGYTKPLLGNLAALEIGLGPIRQECPFFNTWLTTLESLP